MYDKDKQKGSIVFEEIEKFDPLFSEIIENEKKAYGWSTLSTSSDNSRRGSIASQTDTSSKGSIVSPIDRSSSIILIIAIALV